MVKPKKVDFIMVKNKITYNLVTLTFTTSIVCAFLNQTSSFLSFFSIPFFLSVCYLGLNPIVAGISFIIGFLPTFSTYKIVSAIITAVITCPVFLIGKKSKKRFGAKILFVSFISALPFLSVNDTREIIISLIQVSLCILLTPLFISSSRVLYIKRFKYKCTLEELICLSIFTVSTCSGFIHFFGFNVFRSACIFILLFSSGVFGGAKTTTVAVILAVAPSLLSLSLNYFASFTLLSLLISLFSSKYRFLSVLFAILGDLFFSVVLKLYGEFVYTDVFYAVIPASIYLFMPNQIILNLKRKAYSLSDKLLPKYAINRMRTTISGKLYEVAGVFSEMKYGLENLKNSVVSDDELFSKMADEVLISVCETCPSFTRCSQKNIPDREELIKIISIGASKNRISLIDLTKKFVSECGYVNSIIFEINELIAKYRDKVKEINDLSNGKQLITLQTGGVSSVLKNLALDFSKTLSISSEIEKTLTDALHKKGLSFLEIMVLGEGDDLEINLVVNAEEFNGNKLTSAISQALGKQMSLVSKTAISIHQFAVSLRALPMLDASFGLAVKKKNGSDLSGDTHALAKINQGCFLVALSDGMGSGNVASKTSSTAISLIESFYKAGLESNTVLQMVNKVLAISTDDNFSAIDVLTVNLFNLSCDFIKIGSPNSYVITDETIRIVEGNSLPLGILDDIKPTGVSLLIDKGVTILMVTDGISDAFGSSTDMINYLKSQKTLNPQVLADNLLNKAVELDGGSPKDDMTVLSIRIFKKAS